MFPARTAEFRRRAVYRARAMTVEQLPERRRKPRS
jgi:hypothetical protein